MDDAGKQIVDSIKKSSNILVTVSTNPSVDELSAALALTIILNNMDKRTSAVFSGAIPPAITFLEPDKTFEHSADSLRDFIIALNKEKADHLRYKVDGDVVKIFITPYKTTLSEKDLEFSQGDYNVELVLALGVRDQDHLDKALESHGKILHDATVITVTAGVDKSTLGSIDWHNSEASSLSEMIVSLSDGLKGDEAILDQQIATALLTGVVSATDRFSNNRTTSKAMTMAAQLMAAGANQQLIAAKLEEAHDIDPVGGGAPSSESMPSEGGEVSEGGGSELTIDRPGRTSEAKTSDEVTTESLADAPGSPEAELEKQLAGITGEIAPGDSLADIEKELQQATDALGPNPSANAPVDLMSPPAPEVPIAPAPEPPAINGIPVIQPLTPLEAPDPTPTGPPQIMNDHNGKFAPNPLGQAPINSIQNDPTDGETTIDPFTGPMVVPQPAPIAPDMNIGGGTAEGAALLATEPDMAVMSPTPVMPQMPQMPVLDPIAPVTPMAVEPMPQMTVPQLPPLPPLPTADLPPLPPPPPLPPALGMAPGTIPAGAVSGDIFGDVAGTPPPPSAPAPGPGQFKIPGS